MLDAKAVVKATGEGLTRQLDSFVVSVTPDHGEVLSCDPSLGTPDSWFLGPVPVGPGYRAAVAVRGGYQRIALRLAWWDASPRCRPPAPG